jgi:rare lipoprotein A
LLAGLAGVAPMSGDAVAAQCGKAAWYDLDGQTASGERSNGSELAAAHRTLPFGTRVRVENLANGRDVIVRINDRGPFVNGRVIDVTRAAAEELGMIRSGIAKVRVSVVDGKTKLDASCEDPAPRVITADAVASGAAKAKARPDPEPAETQTAAVAEPNPLPAGNDAADADTPAEAPETAAATPAPNQSKPGTHESRKVLVATVQYDEGTGESAPSRSASRASTGDAAAFTEDPQIEDLEDAKIVASVVDIPLPRPRPPVFGEAAPAFNRTLALRFLDAFAPGEASMELTVPLGYAPSEARGAIITE